MALAGLANAVPEAQNRFAPQPAPVQAQVPPEAFKPANYQFGYEVVDAEAGNAYGHRESTDSGVTKGEFRIVLPDELLHTSVHIHQNYLTSYLKNGPKNKKMTRTKKFIGFKN